MTAASFKRKIKAEREALTRWLNSAPRDPIAEMAARWIICGLDALAINNRPIPEIVAEIERDIAVMEWATR